MTEIPHPKLEEVMTTCFPIVINIGMLLAQIFGYLYIDSSTYSWRIIQLGLVAPLFTLLICFFYLGETPRSLIMKGKLEEDESLLKKIRGIEDVEEEYNKILLDTRAIESVKGPYKIIFKQYCHPALFTTILIQIFQLIARSAALEFFGPLMFTSIGFKPRFSQLSVIIMSAMQILAIPLSVVLTKFVGRRRLLLLSCLVMCVSEVIFFPLWWIFNIYVLFNFISTSMLILFFSFLFLCSYLLEELFTA
jgi:Na+/melibiose symporter-like transporter